jgi:UDP-N-acetylglucosamine transferase subunit ALG13
VIFVIMGMEKFPFDRLAKALDDLQGSKAISDEVFIQLGSCTHQPKHARFQKFLSFSEVLENVKKASVVVTHAGVGSTLVCLQQGKHPIMVPRRARYGEHVDDHQVPFATKLSQGGLATMVEDPRELAPAIARVKEKQPNQQQGPRATELTSWLQGFWNNLARF